MKAPVDPARGISGRYVAVGVFVPVALWFGIFGAGALAFDHIPRDIFPTALFGWVFGDIIVLTTIGTTLMVTRTPVSQRSRAYVKGYFS